MSEEVSLTDRPIPGTVNERIPTALSTLGPERVERGELAFSDPAARGNSARCFLARAFGVGESWSGHLMNHAERSHTSWAWPFRAA